MTYGFQLEASEYRPLRDVIGEIQQMPSGNIALRIGREISPGEGWYQIGYVVLARDEALALGDELWAQVGDLAPSPGGIK